MADRPYLVVGARLSDEVTEELTRITKAYLRAHDMPVVGQRLHIALCNTAIDWWNALQPEEREGLT